MNSSAKKTLAQPVKLGDHLLRLTAPNPGMMTGNGTNTYLLSRNGKYAVLDPGPDMPEHIDAILKTVGDAKNITAILVTHMHPDHSPAAIPLAKLSGAPIFGWHPVDDPFQDTSCIPDNIVGDNQLLDFEGLTIRCIHTPGHVDNHVCYLFEDEQILFTGDHIMQGSTVVIIPPHGKMKPYLESLQRLHQYPIRQLAPGHGELIHQPQQEINGIISHRLAREAKVLEKLEQLFRVSIEELTPAVYDDVDPGLHVFAQFSLLAHLIKLETEGRVKQVEQNWFLNN